MKKEIIFIVKSILIWFVGYSMMWFTKWILASVILHVNVFEYVMENALFRMNGKIHDWTYLELCLNAIMKNIYALYPINLIQDKRNILLILSMFLVVFCILKKDKKELKKIIPFLILSIVPYIRYCILANHSYVHYFFTCRLQFIVIMNFIILLGYGIDKKKLKKKIEIHWIKKFR